MLYLRSAVFNIVFYANLVVLLIGGFWLLAAPRSWAMAGLKLWGRTSVWWLEKICRTRLVVRGLEHIPPGPVLVAGKHQSAFETFALFPLLDDPAIVLKKELMWIPVMGWFSIKFRHIPIDRGASSAALRNLIAHARTAIGMGRQIIIFPEGTRRAPGAPADYRPGASALYARLDTPCIPFALNSGVFWPKRSFLRFPGTIVVEFLAPIPQGLPRKAFEARLKSAIEPAAQRLLEEARAGH